MRAKQERILKIVITIVMLVLGLVCIYPFVFMLSSSFKPSGDVLSTPLQIIPANFTLMNFETLFTNEYYDFFRWFGNTVVMTGLTLILKFFIITITAYGFAKIKFPGRDAIFLVLLAGLMIPSDIMIMPRYIIPDPARGGRCLLRVPAAPGLRGGAGSSERGSPHRRVQPLHHLPAHHPAPVHAAGGHHAAVQLRLELERLHGSLPVHLGHRQADDLGRYQAVRLRCRSSSPSSCARSTSSRASPPAPSRAELSYKTNVRSIFRYA